MIMYHVHAVKKLIHTNLLVIVVVKAAKAAKIADPRDSTGSLLAE
jgi:hypothetical protein